MEDFDHYYLMGVFVPALVFTLIWLTALILAIVFWRRHRAVCGLLVISALLLLLNSTVGTYFSYWIPRQAIRNQWDIRSIDRAMIHLAWARSGVNAVASILLIWAALGWRAAAKPRHFFEEDWGDE